MNTPQTPAGRSRRTRSPGPQPGSAARRAGRRAGRRVGHRAGVLLCVLGLAVGAGLVGFGLGAGEPPDAPLPDQPFSLGAPAAPAPATGSPEPAGSYPADRLRIESLDIDAALVPGRLEADGELVVPGDVSTVALWSSGPGLHATAGTTVLAGHVDSDGDLGALHPLHRITPHAPVLVTDSTGRATRWRVVELSVTPKDELPQFTATGARRLAIVTCGGAVIHTAQGRRYSDNVIAIAEPA